jgi:hypothetical protein
MASDMFCENIEAHGATARDLVGGNYSGILIWLVATIERLCSRN